VSEPDARRVAYEVVRRTFEQGAYADRAFAGEASGLEGRERRQAMRMAYGAVQRMRTVDHAVEQLGGRRPMRLQAPLRGVADKAIRIGLPVRVTFERVKDGLTLPAFVADG